MSHIFMKGGYFCNVSKDPAEVYEKFMLRGYSMVSQKPKTIDEHKQCELYSRYLNNIKYLGCVFGKHIRDICNAIEMKMFV